MHNPPARFRDILSRFITSICDAISSNFRARTKVFFYGSARYGIFYDNNRRDSRKAARETSGDKEVTWQSKKETWRINWKRARARTRVGLRSCEWVNDFRVALWHERIGRGRGKEKKRKGRKRYWVSKRGVSLCRPCNIRTPSNQNEIRKQEK